MKRYFQIQVVLDKNRPKIQSVVNKIDSIQNEYRTMQLEVLAGNHSLVTTVVENGIRFQVDLATVYALISIPDQLRRLDLLIAQLMSFHEICLVLCRHNLDEIL